MDYTTNDNSAESGILPFDPIVLLQDVLKRWLIVITVALGVGVAAYILTDMSYEPQYRTETTFVVTTRGSSSSIYSDLSSTTDLAAVFTELLNSSILRKTIMQELGMTSFRGTITTSVIPETNLITMRVTASDPWTAFVVARSIIDHHETLTYRVVDSIILEVLQAPAMPTSAINASYPMRNMIRMMVAAAVATACFFAVMSFLRDAVRSGKEAWKKLDCYYMGEIPYERKHKTLSSWIHRRKSSILVTDPLTSFHFVETMRKLRHRVEQHMDGGKVLMVASLLENEGKSTVAVNLALSMEQKHSRVLLIDCDMRKPACHLILRQNEVRYGLVDVLQGKANAQDALIRYQDSGIFMLLETKGSSKPGDLLASEEMAALLEWARENFDVVILDLPPISVASDSETVKELADASLLVVRQNRATAKALNKAVASLDGGRAKLIGCVLNGVRRTRLTSGHGYGYGYGYGHYNHYERYGNKR